MKTKEMRLRKIQHLAHEIMYEVNVRKELEHEPLRGMIDNLSRAIGDLSDPLGDYSISYIEEKVENAHSLLFKHKKKIQFHF
ncbi:hypothetical protein [Domibacillus mangrovi]|uniref:Group-specific protein n=1 Tax=Domibacillus mangrovi TaxID=1714354 RepID=A0A1Q5P360_9BACI|nr:hypothetical protein [Domibacillus mangrovi]OKL36666.1 hypothetical protein BLL40_07975 [Domibacillus mangrovi]